MVEESASGGGPEDGSVHGSLRKMVAVFLLLFLVGEE